jgi:hypothetical protein
MTKIFGPRGWSADQITTRFLSSAPSSFNRETRSVNACLSRGAPVKRFYGTEVLRVTPEAVDLGRLKSAGIPLLDSHNSSGIGSALGRVRSVWFDGGALMGTLTFNETAVGSEAMGMIERSEICSLSCGYRVESWAISDARILGVADGRGRAAQARPHTHARPHAAIYPEARKP